MSEQPIKSNFDDIKVGDMVKYDDKIIRIDLISPKPLWQEVTATIIETQKHEPKE